MCDRLRQVSGLVLFCGVLAGSSGARAAIETAVALSPTHAVAGDSVKVVVYHTNPADRSEALLILPQLDCLLQTGEGAVAARLQRKASSAPLEVVLSPAAFRKAVYTLRLPEGVSGAVTVELVGLAANPTVLQIMASPSPDAAAAVSPPSVDHEQEEPTAQESEGGGETAGAALFSNFSSHEPIYFIVGGKSDGAKLQLGFKYRFFNPEGPMATRWRWLDDLYLAYTQTSIWDIYEDSSPFRDTNYKPELIYYKQGLKENWGWISRFDMQGGFRHESNGQAGSDSRSINYIYAKPIFHFGNVEKFHLTVIPRAWFYVGDDSDNPDIDKFRGYVDLELNIGSPDSVELKSYYRMGTAGKGAVQLDLSYPLWELLFRNLNLYLYAQFFHGYGESLLSYDRKDTTIRAGFGLTR
jgi:outer membrane phospholipase A